MSDATYYLSNDASFCFTDNHYVFFDLRNDEYWCLGRKDSEALKFLLNSQPSADADSNGIRLQNFGGSEAIEVTRSLVEKGLLVRNGENGKAPQPECELAPTVSTVGRQDQRLPRVGPTHVTNFYTAAAIASAKLRWWPIERTVKSVAARKAANASVGTAPDISRITELYAIFQTLRPYYHRKYLCLFDCLALLQFLARYSLFPQWVYGVKLQPFGAHCWVQVGDTVVNDIMDNVKTYTPIMSI